MDIKKAPLYVAEGVVIGNNASGNIYKNVMPQDATAALTLSSNATGLYNDYRIGQKWLYSDILPSGIDDVAGEYFLILVRYTINYFGSLVTYIITIGHPCLKKRLNREERAHNKTLIQLPRL
ncbi:MAG: DUF5689 domain-containing protein [Bacteroidales bacterium]